VVKICIVILLTEYFLDLVEDLYFGDSQALAGVGAGVEIMVGEAIMAGGNKYEV